MNSLITAKNVRKSILKMTNNGKSSHVGSALSCTDILSVLYSNIIDVEKIKDQLFDRDRFVMSKGHAGAALYAVLAEKGIINKDILLTHYQNGSNLSGHVSHKLLKGVEISTGSLGHGLPISIGIAYGLKINRMNSNVFCLMSDGELDEGSNWEAFLFGAHHKLKNLIVIIDRNNLQSIKNTEQTLALEPLDNKLLSFGWDVYKVNGHDHQEIENTIKKAKNTMNPSIIIANTIKGKGVPFYENTFESHYKILSKSEFEKIKHL